MEGRLIVQRLRFATRRPESPCLPFQHAVPNVTMNSNAHTTRFSHMIRLYVQQIPGANGENVTVSHSRSQAKGISPRKARQKNAMTVLQSYISLGFQLSSGGLYLDRIC
jgi:hypothetical protein